MILAEKLSHLLRKHGLTQRDLAERIDCSHPAVGDWTRGKSRPRPAIARRLAAAFDLPVESLMDDRLDLPETPMEQLRKSFDLGKSEFPDNPEAAHERGNADYVERTARERCLAAAAKMEEHVTWLREQGTALAKRRGELDREIRSLEETIVALRHMPSTPTTAPKSEIVAAAQREAEQRRSARSRSGPHRGSSVA